MKRIKVLVLGSRGMLGSGVLRTLSSRSKIETYGTHISRGSDFSFDARGSLDALLTVAAKSGGIDYMINCIGITADRIDPGRPESVRQALEVNGLFPHRLSEFAGEHKMRVIHISTDGVFSDAAGECNEERIPDAKGVYSQTKALGEVDDNESFLTFRCSLLGPSPFEKRGIFEWFCSQPDGAAINGFINHSWNGVTTLQFAELCAGIIESGDFNDITSESRLYHFCPNNPVTKYELLTILKDVLKKDITITACNDPRRTVTRVLRTRYQKINRFFGCNKDMKDVLYELIASYHEMPHM